MTSQNDCTENVLYFDPFAEIFDGQSAQEFDSWDMGLSEPEDRVSMHVVMAGAPHADNLGGIMAGLASGEDDPFSAGKHFLSRPQTTNPGSFSYSLAFLLPAEDMSIITGEPIAKDRILDINLTDGSSKAVAIGYATLHIRFSRDRDSEGDDDIDPNDYSLFVHPDAFFLDARLRGHGYGRFMGAVLADSVKGGLYRINRLARLLGVRAEINIMSYYELYSEGGEAAVGLFHSELEEAADLEWFWEEDEAHIHVRKFESDGGW